jgi:hypothetical protein
MLGFSAKLGWASHRISSCLKNDARGKRGLRGFHPENCQSSSDRQIAPDTWGVEGALGARGYGYDAAMRFAVLAFDPSQLPAFVYGARAIASSWSSVE